MKILLLLLVCSLPWKRDCKMPPTLVRIPFQAAWETTPVTEEIRSILQQPFTYLAKGNQTYVFASEDGHYVLKLFRYTRSRFPLIHACKSLFWKKSKNDFYTKLQKTFQAAKIASDEAKEYTQVVFSHLNPTTDTLPTVMLKAHRTWQIPLDQYRFVLQKRATPFCQALLEAKDDREKMERLIRSFVELIAKRSALGIRNSDPNLLPNFGFIQGQAVEIDFGNYRKPHLYDPRLKQAEWENLFSRLRHWLSKNVDKNIWESAYINSVAHFAPAAYDLNGEAALQKTQ